MLCEKDQSVAVTTETRIGNTTYIISSQFSETSRETAAIKMSRILQNQIRQESQPPAKKISF